MFKINRAYYYYIIITNYIFCVLRNKLSVGTYLRLTVIVSYAEVIPIGINCLYIPNNTNR